MVATIGDSRATLRADVSPAPRERGFSAAPSEQHAPMRALRAARSQPSARRIIAALPQGTRLADSCDDWLRAVEEHPATAQLRADAHGHLLAVAGVLARAADWGNLTTRPTWERLCERTGLGRRTVARWLAWLRAEALLGVVESGSTPQLRPMALAHLEGNRAALYVLATPVTSSCPVDETGTPPGLTEGESPTHTRDDPEQSPLRGPDSRTAAPGAVWGWTTPTRDGRSRLACAQRLRERVPALRDLSDRHLRHLLRPWLLAGWTAADVLHAIDHAPDGSAHTWTTSVRTAKGWLRHRLARWTDVAGAPLAPLSAGIAANVERSRTEQQERRQASAERRALVEAEESLSARLVALAGDRWARLLDAFGRGPARRPGAMSNALARHAVVTALGSVGADVDTTTDAQLLAALDVALVEAAA